jgi:hypothetical protein
VRVAAYERDRQRQRATVLAGSRAKISAIMSSPNDRCGGRSACCWFLFRFAGLLVDDAGCGSTMSFVCVITSIRCGWLACLIGRLNRGVFGRCSCALVLWYSKSAIYEVGRRRNSLGLGQVIE